VDTRLAIASRREVRNYADRELPAEVVERILEAGRLAGSVQNRQDWRFLVVESPDVRAGLAKLVFAPSNVQGAKLVVAIVMSGKGPLAFDAGRAAENMLLAAWNEGIGSCPNGMLDPDAVRDVLRLRDDERAVIVLTFGYPARPTNPESRTSDEWSARANRKPLEEIVTRL
jgi:nitroreductase